ncbi:MAG: hypothetical protein ABI183_18660 [Polyangiaceae bacterium]
MTLRHVIFPGILAISAACAASSACSAPDPGLVIFSTNPAKIKTDSGVIAIGDAATGETGPAPPASIFDGQPAYISTSGPSTDQANHMKLFGTTDPAGMDCLSCHETDATTPFVFGGTVVGAGDAGANNVQVLILNTDASVMSTYTDQHGNFFFEATGQINPGAKVGVRNAATVQQMPDPLTGSTQGGCNQKGTCHGGTEGPVHLP